MASVVDLFCGVGGLTRGFLDENLDVVAGIDNDITCQFAYEYNNKPSKFIHTRLEDISPSRIKKLFRKNEPRILIGCAPCQPFSSYSNRYNTDVFKDKWHLVQTFGEYISQIKPEIISMENVPALQKKDIYKSFCEVLISLNYHIDDTIVYAPDYGIPQTRKRLVLLASRLGEIKLLEPTHKPKDYPTVRTTISKLPEIDAGGVDPNDPLHKSRNLSTLNRKRIKASNPGGSWTDWDEELIAECHKKTSGHSYGSVYGRMVWDEPAPTITTQAYAYGSGRFGHPKQNRALSLREMAMLQTFPHNYQFAPSNREITFNSVGVHIGNAVPVLLARRIAQSINVHLNSNII